MSNTALNKDLKLRLKRRFRTYVVSRVTIAVAVTISIALVSSFSVFLISDNIPLAISVLLIAGLISIQTSFTIAIPEESVLPETEELMLQILQNPNMIGRSSVNDIRVKAESGKTRKLRGFERIAWLKIVTPHLMRYSVDSLKSKKAQNPGSTALFDGAVEESTSEIQSELDALLCFKKKLEAEKSDLEKRNLELFEAEDLVIERLHNVEIAEAELKQLQIEANETQENEPDELILRLAEKEFEVEKLKAKLHEDQEIVRAQKTELNQLKGELISEFSAGAPQSSPISDQLSNVGEHSAELQKIECLQEQLNERDSHLTEAENILMERLQELVEREAQIEQKEINVGLRHD